jgi:hypothetical protein
MKPMVITPAKKELISGAGQPMRVQKSLISIWPPKNSSSIHTRSGTPRTTVEYSSASQTSGLDGAILNMAPISPSTTETASDATATCSVSTVPSRMLGR